MNSSSVVVVVRSLGVIFGFRGVNNSKDESPASLRLNTFGEEGDAGLSFGVVDMSGVLGSRGVAKVKIENDFCSFITRFASFEELSMLGVRKQTLRTSGDGGRIGVIWAIGILFLVGEEDLLTERGILERETGCAVLFVVGTRGDLSRWSEAGCWRVLLEEFSHGCASFGISTLRCSRPRSFPKCIVYEKD